MPLTLDDTGAPDAETLAAELTEHERTLHILNLRLPAAKAAADTERITQLTKLLDEQTKYADFYKRQLAELHPTYKRAKTDFRADGERVIVEDALAFNAERNRMKLQYRAAKFTENKEHADAAQREVDRLTAYLNYYRPQFERIVKKLNAQNGNGHGEIKKPPMRR